MTPISPYWQPDVTPKPIPPLERAWVETRLAAMALAPDTRDDYRNQSVGMPCGVARPEYGPGVYDLACQVCAATWSDIPGAPCWWCERAEQIQTDHQIDLLLAPPDIHPDDPTRDARVEGWVARMQVGIDAGLIVQEEAERAYRLAMKSVAA